MPLSRIHQMSYFAKAFFLGSMMISAASAQTFDLRDLEEEKQEEELNALESFLYKNAFKSPVGRFASVDDWEENMPIVKAGEKLKVATSLIQAARNENDARALSAVLAAYRDGADKELASEENEGPSISFGATAARGNTDRNGNSRDRGIPQKSRGPFRQHDPETAPKPTGLETNDRLGVRIVSNLAVFRSCSGALVAYLNRLGNTDTKAAPWARMIQRSLGFAALPPDDSCLDAN